MEALPDALDVVRTTIAPVRTLLVLSGSCALQTARQIDAAEHAGWLLLHLDPRRLADETAIPRMVEALASSIGEALERGRPVVVYTARGLDGRLDATREVPATRVGAVFAELIRIIRSRVDLPRVVLAGGDSSSYAVRSSGALSLDIATFDEAQNSHVCRLGGERAAIDGLEVMLKGGQVGADDFFLRALSGSP